MMLSHHLGLFRKMETMATILISKSEGHWLAAALQLSDKFFFLAALGLSCSTQDL